MTLSEVIQAINSLGVLLTGAAALWAVMVSKRGVVVSKGNADALATVRLNQDTNKTAIIEGVKHELNNGSGDVIAAKTAAHMTPVIEEMKKTIPVEVAKTAEVVAAALIEASGRQENDLSRTR